MSAPVKEKKKNMILKTWVVTTEDNYRCSLLKMERQIPKSGSLKQLGNENGYFS